MQSKRRNSMRPPTSHVIQASRNPTEKGSRQNRKARLTLSEFPGIERTREGSPLLPDKVMVSTLEWYQHRHIICTGYINIMLSRFLVKCAPPKEIVASATAETGYRWRRRCRRSEYYSGNLQRSSSSTLKALLFATINFFYVQLNNFIAYEIWKRISFILNKI